MASRSPINRNPKLKDRYTTHRVKIDEDIISLTTSLLSYDTRTAYAVLGAQLAQIERPLHAFQTILGFGAGLDVPRISIDYVLEGYDFLRTFWPKMVLPVCSWWQHNKGKEGRELMKEVCAIITYLLPLPYNLIQGVISIIAVIVVKNGLDKLCTNKKGRPPEP